MRLTIPVLAAAFLIAVQPLNAQQSRQGDDAPLSVDTLDRGGVQILSDTHGVDLSAWLKQWHRETERNWKVPKASEVHAPVSKPSKAAIRFKVLPNGRLKDGSMVLESRTGTTAFDRAAWFALIDSRYPPLPDNFHGPYIELRVYFVYDTGSHP